MIMPERINAMKVVTYGVDNIVSELKESGVSDPTLEDVLEFLQDWLYEDFVHVDGIILQDEDGNEL